MQARILTGAHKGQDGKFYPMILIPESPIPPFIIKNPQETPDKAAEIALETLKDLMEGLAQNINTESQTIGIAELTMQIKNSVPIASSEN